MSMLTGPRLGKQYAKPEAYVNLNLAYHFGADWKALATFNLKPRD